MDKVRALSLGILSGLVIICGVLLGVLTWMLVNEVVDGVKDAAAANGGTTDYSAISSVSGPVWLGGIVYVLPGVLCLIAALVQNKCVYILSCLLSLLCSAVVGLVLFIVGWPILQMIIALVVVKETCVDKDGMCQCTYENSASPENTSFESCDALTAISNLTIGIFAIICLGLVFLLASFIMACIYACRSKQTQGTVYTPAQQPMLQG